MAEKTNAGDKAVKMVKYKLPRLPGSKNADVFVRVNDTKYLIKRGVEVEIPDFVAEVLDNSQKQDDKTADLIDQLAKNQLP